MKKAKQIFWGIDISKNVLDVCLEQDGKVLLNFQVENSPSKIRMALSHFQWTIKCMPMAVTPAEDFLASGPLGSPVAPAAKSYVISNPGDAAINWTASRT